MRKLEGLRFLQQFFPDQTVDCLFVDKVENLTDKVLYNTDKDKQIWRVRAGKKTGSELNVPQGSFTDPEKLRKYIETQSAKDSDMEFVIHRVSPEYFAAPFVGTIASYNNFERPGIKIEVQKVTKELVDAIDTGKRPRDWEACLILDYDFLCKFPKVVKKDPDVDMEFIKKPLMVIHEIGEEIFKHYDEKGIVEDTYTRFNIYNLGQVLLDDHRSGTSFVPKVPTPTIRPSFYSNSEKAEEDFTR